MTMTDISASKEIESVIGISLGGIGQLQRIFTYFRNSLLVVMTKIFLTSLKQPFTVIKEFTQASGGLRSNY